MKVLHVYKTYRPETIGGVENFIYSLCLELQKNKVQSDVLTTTAQLSHQFWFYNSRVYAFQRSIDLLSCPISMELLKNFRDLVARYDLIHYHHPWPFADLMHLLVRIKTPSLVTYHSDIVRQKKLNLLYQPMQKLFLQKTNAIIATSDNISSSSKILQHHQQKTSCIPISMSKDLYPPASDERNNKWLGQLGAKFYLFIGVLRYYKGLHILLEAIVNTNLPLVIVGAGPEELKLQALARQLKLKQVIFLGHVSEEDKISLLSICYAVVCPSHLRAEAFGINLLEGLMFAKPLISTDLGTGTTFVNRHDISGLVVPPQRADLLRDAMLRLYNDPQLYQRLKEGAQQHFKETFTSHHIGEHYLNKYQSILAAHKAQAANFAAENE